jgi:hypothetical protein
MALRMRSDAAPRILMMTDTEEEKEEGVEEMSKDEDRYA